MTSAYDAFVSADGKADYLLPSAAFAAGKVRIFVQPGIYNESKDIVIPEGGSMTGANRGTTIIDFGSNSASVVVDSSYGTVQNTGTVSIATGASTLYGTSTSFTSLSGSNAFVFLNSRAYAIASVTSDTELTLARVYNGSPLADVPYKALNLVSHTQIRDFTIRNSSSNGVHLRGARQCKVYNVGIENCNVNVLLENCTECTLQDNDSDFGASDGFRVLASSCCEFRWGNALSNVGFGFYCDSSCTYLVIASMHASANGTNFRILGDNNCLSQSVGDHAAVNGLDIDGNTSKVIGCAFTNSGVDNVHVFSTALSALITCVNFNGAGNSEFNNESATTQYACTYP